MRSVAFSILVLAGVSALVTAFHYNPEFGPPYPLLGACCGLPLVFIGLGLLAVDLFATRFFQEAAGKMKKESAAAGHSPPAPGKPANLGGGPAFPIVDEGSAPEPPLRPGAGRAPRDDEDFPDNDLTVPEDSIR